MMKKTLGFSLIELLIGLGIVALIVVKSTKLLTEYTQVRIGSATADYHNAVINAAQIWLKDNYATVVAGSTATSPYVLTMSTLKSSGALDTSYADKNRYGQTPCILVLQPSNKKLSPLFVTEGGEGLTVNQQQVIAIRMQSGGVIENNGSGLRAEGNTGSYSIPLNNYLSGSCSGTAASVGHVVAAMNYDASITSAPFLYRTEVTGNPDANTLFTNLNLNNNNINNVNVLNAKTVNTTDLNASNIRGDCFISKSDPNFFVCPANDSNINTATANTIAANKFLGRVDNSFFVTPDGDSNIKNVTAEKVTASLLIDKENAAFTVDPASTSRIRNAIVTDRKDGVRLSSLLANFVDCATSIPLGDGGTVAACVCQDGGQTSIYLIPEAIKLPADLVINPRATLSGSNWLVSIKDGSGNPVPGTRYFAKLGCYFD